MKTSIVALILSALMGTSLAAQDIPQVPTEVPPPTAYALYRQAKPALFESVEHWVRDNYTTFLVPSSLQPLSDSTTTSVSFWTLDDNIYDHTIVTDDGDALVIRTTASLAPQYDAEGESTPSNKASNARSTATCNTSTNRCNCVLYARCLVPTLPYGLFTYSDKARIINSSQPAVGSVAVMNIYPPYGHVGVVSAVRRNSMGRLVVTLNEANYRSCQITTTRTNTPAALKITGYFKP